MTLECGLLLIILGLFLSFSNRATAIEDQTKQNHSANEGTDAHWRFSSGSVVVRDPTHGGKPTVAARRQQPAAPINLH